MLISHKHKFIFIHIYKNAGTSITNALVPFTTQGWQYLANRCLKKAGISSFDIRPCHTHAEASEIRETVGERIFDSYFKFAIVRNPWDWQVSLYTYMLNTPRHHQHELVKKFGNFDEYIKWRCDTKVKYQKDFVLSDSGERMVNFIGKFETLQEDFRYICSRIGISASLPVLNVSNSTPYHTYYRQDTINLVKQTFAPDIELFSYHFNKDLS